MAAKRKHSVEGVLFDWDGTLINSYHADTSAYLAMFKEMDISWGIEEFEKNYSPNWYQVYRAAGLPRRHAAQEAASGTAAPGFAADGAGSLRVRVCRRRGAGCGDGQARRCACDWRARSVSHGKASARGPAGVSDRFDRGIAGRSKEIAPLMDWGLCRRCLWFRRSCRSRRRWRLRRSGNGFEIRPLDDKTNRNLQPLQIQRVIRAGIAWEPVFSVDIFAIGFEQSKGQIRDRVYVALIGNPFSVCFHDFQIFRIYPHDAIEIGLDAFDDSWLGLKNVAIDFVHLLFAQVFYIVFRELA